MTPGAPKVTLGAKARFWTFSERRQKALRILMGGSWDAFGEPWGALLELWGDFWRAKVPSRTEKAKK